MSAPSLPRSSIAVIVNGLPGAMGMQVSKACLARGLVLAPAALTGPGMPVSVNVDSHTVALVDATAPGAIDTMRACVAELKAKGLTPIAIDFTHPSAVNKNADMYNALGLPFVMGTTGGDREQLLKSTREAGTPAVIAPNMCKQIVAFQAMMKHMAETYPGAFEGYTLRVEESHQKTKADTSGTAKAVVESLGALVKKPMPERDIKKLRTDADSASFGVPREHLDGHAYHTYRLTSGDGSVTFEFKHNVNGRSTYAEGVADAVIFLADRIAAGKERRVYDMIDVLRSGAML